MFLLYRFRFLAFITTVFIFSHCASPKPLTGGVSDTTPPVIIEEASTANQQTNFKEDQIVLTFDEWVALKDVYSQLVISPPMPNEPQIRQKGKSIIIDLPDNLRAETTYTINFGDAITDLNEGNALENFVFVFSTGPVLDSIRISGTVLDAVAIKPADKVWVMLYHSGDDSVVYKRKPDYLARTNKEGKWSISFLPADTFDVVALKDANLNFLYDQDSELFGWLNEPIITDEQSENVPTIFVFPFENRSVVREVIHDAPGWLKIVVDAPLPKPSLSFLPEIENSITLWAGDTLHVLYNPENNYSGYVVLEDDSTRVRISSQPSLLKSPLLVRPVTGRIKPDDKAVFSLSVPAVILDANLITIQFDSFSTIPFQIRRDSHDIRLFYMNAPWKADTRYQVLFLPGAITDFWGRTNDTIRQSVVVINDDQFGDLFMTVDGLDSTKQYLIHLKQGEHIRDTFVVEEKSGIKLVKRGLLPAAYSIEIIEDANRNFSWDTGNYYNRRQPERKMIFIPEKLRAGWEQEVIMIWK